MNKKIGTILVCFLLSSIILLVANNEFDVEASGGGGTDDGGDNSIGLDMDYMKVVLFGEDLTRRLVSLHFSFPSLFMPLDFSLVPTGGKFSFALKGMRFLWVFWQNPT